jgi:hypothetical protein
MTMARTSTTRSNRPIPSATNHDALRPAKILRALPSTLVSTLTWQCAGTSLTSSPCAASRNPNQRSATGSASASAKSADGSLNPDESPAHGTSVGGRDANQRSRGASGVTGASRYGLREDRSHVVRGLRPAIHRRRRSLLADFIHWQPSSPFHVDEDAGSHPRRRG